MESSSIELLEAHFSSDRNCGYTSCIYKQSLRKRSSIHSTLFKVNDRIYEDIDLKIDLNPKKTILKPGQLLIICNDGEYETKTNSETYKFMVEEQIIVRIKINLPSNMSKMNILVDLSPVKSGLINNSDTGQKNIYIFIDQYETGEALIECSGDLRFFNYNREKNYYLYCL